MWTLLSALVDHISRGAALWMRAPGANHLGRRRRNPGIGFSKNWDAE
jgi:hypothetical protein